MKTIGLIGDYILDIYSIGEWKGSRFIEKKRVKRGGGANNVERYFLQNEGQIFPPSPLTNFLFYPITDFSPDTWPELHLLIPSSPQIEIFTPAPFPYHETPITREYDGIVVSDYNKGMVRALVRSVQNLSYNSIIADWIIVDSKYRSTHTEIINLGRYRIWRCTGDEYSIDYASNFDCIVHTDGPKNIRVFPTKGGVSSAFEVPKIDVVDTTGAGDTFTAALASKLILEEEVDFDIVCSHIPFCIEEAQKECMRRKY